MRSHISSFFFIKKSHSWYSLNLSLSLWKTRVLFCPQWTKPSSSLGRFGGIEWTSNLPLWPKYFYLIYPQSLLYFSTCSQCIKIKSFIFLNSSVQFSHSVMSDSLRPHESQHARSPCPSPTPGVYPNLCPSSQWCHPAISSNVIPFSSCPQSLPASHLQTKQVGFQGVIRHPD